MLNRPLSLLLSGARCFVLLCLPSLSHSAVLEEVIVTAQFREQSLQDVPVSVSALSGEKMMEAGLNKIQDLQAYVPNLTMSENGIGTAIYIRGIGSGINQGFEQSVGMYVDGIYYGRAQLARAPFLDLARVEVLRGPQNILYGKNSIAGAISIITAKPSDEFEGMVAVVYEPKYDEQVFDITLSGPLSDTVGYRFSARKREFSGYIENLTLGRDEPSYECGMPPMILPLPPKLSSVASMYWVVKSRSLMTVSRPAPTRYSQVALTQKLPMILRCRV
jgi:iron complex outermembrane receptor protein